MASSRKNILQKTFVRVDRGAERNGVRRILNRINDFFSVSDHTKNVGINNAVLSNVAIGRFFCVRRGKFRKRFCPKVKNLRVFK